MDKEKEILFLDPVCTHNIWGGSRLRTDFHYQEEGEDLGECWGISAHPHGDGTIRNGKYQGCKLSELYKEHRELFGNLPGDRFPLLTKIIDAKQDLSIQVHPDDAYAAEHEQGSFGKMECWYILDCPEGASLVLGHNAKSKEELRSMISEGRWKDFIREVPIRKGDFIQIDPGTVHAIKGGVLLLETQQNSDITYRVYDYDRLQNGKPRELHIEKSIAVIETPAKSPEESVLHPEFPADNQLHLLYSCRYYQVFKLSIEGQGQFTEDYPFLSMSVTEGEGSINGTAIRKGDHFIIPSGFGEVRLTGAMEIIASTVGKS